MEGILIKGISMPEGHGFVDIRVYGSGTVVIPCGNDSTEATAEAVTIPDEE